MSVCLIKSGAQVTVPNFTYLLEKYREFKRTGAISLIRRFDLHERPTEAQLRRLPKELRMRLVIGKVPRRVRRMFGDFRKIQEGRFPQS